MIEFDRWNFEEWVKDRVALEMMEDYEEGYKAFRHRVDHQFSHLPASELVYYLGEYIAEMYSNV